MRANRKPTWVTAIVYYVFVLALMAAALLLAAGAGW